MLRVGEASGRILAEIRPLAAEKVSLRAALGRVCAEDIVATVTMPPWSNSSMDGYAVRSADITAVMKGESVTLRVVGTIAAGDRTDQPVKRGQAMRIMTGAPVPGGADSVIRKEDTDGGAQQDRFVGGSQRVAIRMAEELGPDRLILGQPVRTIRHGADGVLVGRARQSAAGDYEVEWSFSGSGTSGGATGDLEAGPGLAAERFAGIFASHGAAQRSEQTVTVTGISTLEAYASALRTLAKLAPVRGVAVDEVSADSVSFRLNVRGDSEALGQAILREDRLVPIDAARLIYSLSP